MASCVALHLFQAHGERFLKILVENLIDPGITGLHGGCASVLVRKRRDRRRALRSTKASFRAFVCELGVAAVIDADGLHDSQVRQRQSFGRALLVEAVAAVSAVVFAVGEGERSPASHTDVRVGPFRGRTAIDHAAGDGRSRWKLEALSLQCLVCLINILELVSVLGGCSPGLYQLQYLSSNIHVDRRGSNCVKKGDQVVHELPGGNLGEEVVAAILNTCVGQVQSAQLSVRVLVANATLERSHGFLGLYSLGSDDIRNLEVERDIL